MPDDAYMHRKKEEKKKKEKKKRKKEFSDIEATIFLPSSLFYISDLKKTVQIFAHKHAIIIEQCPEIKTFSKP